MRSTDVKCCSLAFFEDANCILRGSCELHFFVHVPPLPQNLNFGWFWTFLAYFQALDRCFLSLNQLTTQTKIYEWGGGGWRASQLSKRGRTVKKSAFGILLSETSPYETGFGESASLGRLNERKINSFFPQPLFHG
jgi:hypothetical protein